MEKEKLQRLANIFFPEHGARQQKIKSAGTRLVHYTSAEAAMNILRTKEFWMREPSCMNDYMEVQHGIDCIVAAYKGERFGEKFQDSLNALFPGITKDIEALFNKVSNNFRYETYLACVSEHLDSEDNTGRLSMWRAYCRSTGVAMVMNSKSLLDGPGVLKVYTSPVLYYSNNDFETLLGQITELVQKESNFLAQVDRQIMINVVFNMFKFAALSMKHPGFSEEREWRVIYSPFFEFSPHLIKSIESINGVPQTIYKVPLKSIPGVGATGGEIPELIDRIIIGPTQFAFATWKAFVTLLGDAGVNRPEEKVTISKIPLR